MPQRTFAGVNDRRVNMGGLSRLLDDIENEELDPDQTLRQFVREFPKELAKVRSQAAIRTRGQLRIGGLYPVEIDGSPTRGLKMGYFKTPLSDGTVGYLQRRTDDCVPAALASLLQMPPHLVPYPCVEQMRDQGRDDEEIDRSVDDDFARWTAEYGLTIKFHAALPTWSNRWVGMMASPNPDDEYSSHTLLMSGRDCLFDPSHLLPPAEPGTVGLENYSVDQIEYGITIDRR